MRELPERLERVEATGTSAFNKGARDTLRCNRMASTPTVRTDEDGEEYKCYEMPFEEFEQHVRDLTGPFADDYEYKG